MLDANGFWSILPGGCESDHGTLRIRKRTYCMVLLGCQCSMGSKSWFSLPRLFFPVSFPYSSFVLQARVHQGFHDAYVELRDKVFKKVNALRAGLRKTVPVFVTGKSCCFSCVARGQALIESLMRRAVDLGLLIGENLILLLHNCMLADKTIGHSMGGAIATLCAFDLGTRLGPSNVMCSTFGCPRIGNTAFHRNYESLGMPTWRFANSHDPVTHLPAAGTSTKDRWVIFCLSWFCFRSALIFFLRDFFFFFFFWIFT